MKRLLLLSLVSLCSYSMQVNSDILRKSAALAQAILIYDKEHFIVDENGLQKVVPRYNMSRELRSLSEDQVKALLSTKNALLYLRKLSDTSYALELEGKLKGGLAVSGWWAYNITRGLIYGTSAAVAATAVTASVVAVVGTGGTAAPVITGVAASIAGKTAAAGIVMGAASVSAPVVATVGGGIVGAGIATGLTTAVGSANVALGTGAVLTAAGGSTGYFAMVEAASLFVGAAFTACPFLP